MHHQLRTFNSPSVITFSTERPRMLVPRSFIAQNAPPESYRCTIRIPRYHQNPAYTHRILFALTACICLALVSKNMQSMPRKWLWIAFCLLYERFNAINCTDVQNYWINKTSNLLKNVSAKRRNSISFLAFGGKIFESSPFLLFKMRISTLDWALFKNKIIIKCRISHAIIWGKKWKG